MTLPTLAICGMCGVWGTDSMGKPFRLTDISVLRWGGLQSAADFNPPACRFQFAQERRADAVGRSSISRRSVERQRALEIPECSAGLARGWTDCQSVRRLPACPTKQRTKKRSDHNEPSRLTKSFRSEARIE